MLKIVGSTVVAGTVILLIETAVQVIGDLTTISKERKKRRTINMFTLYQNIFERFILPDSFLLMKNRGSDLCNHDEKIPFINYMIDNMFM